MAWLNMGYEGTVCQRYLAELVDQSGGRMGRDGGNGISIARVLLLCT